MTGAPPHLRRLAQTERLRAEALFVGRFLAEGMAEDAFAARLCALRLAQLADEIEAEGDRARCCRRPRRWWRRLLARWRGPGPFGPGVTEG